MKRFFLLLLLPAFLAGCSSSDLPAVTDPTQLAKDCDTLVGGTVDSIPPDQWPDSIKNLQPVSVQREGESIYITTFAATGVGARGYVVCRATPSSHDHYTIVATPYPDIYRFDLAP